MQYVRSLDQPPAAHLSHASGVDTAVIAQLESVTALGRTYRPGGGDPAPQCSPGDVYLFVTDGNLVVEVDGRELGVGPEAMAFIPAGAAHLVRSVEAGGEACALVLVMPSPPAGAALFDAAPAPPAPTTGRADGRAFVVALEAAGFDAGSRPNGFAVQTMADASRGVRTCTMNAARVNAGGEGPAVHIHTFDQLFFVVRGRLHVRVALEEVVAATHELVVLPAGVPHTQWNEGPDTEVHLAVLTPAPPAGEPLTRPVTFGPPTG